MISLIELSSGKGRGAIAAAFSLFMLAASAVGFDESKTLRLQLLLDREGFSANAADGQWGRRSQRALAAWCRREGKPLLATPEANFEAYFTDRPEPFAIVEVTTNDLAALTDIPKDPLEKSRLPYLGYPCVAEMFAERGHITVTALKRLNPGVDWNQVSPGLKLVIPGFPPLSEGLRNRSNRKSAAKPAEAAAIRVSLENFEISVLDKDSRTIALFPCSIARDKNKRPQAGELKVVSKIAWPNYTYTADRPDRNGKIQRCVLPPGPRCPVGVAWLGLNLPGYGMHGTPSPETIGRAESHGCFRLSNWNAARLYALACPGVKVMVVP